jgi:hypothetical protein
VTDVACPSGAEDALAAAAGAVAPGETAADGLLPEAAAGAAAALGMSALCAVGLGVRLTAVVGLGGAGLGAVAVAFAGATGGTWAPAVKLSHRLHAAHTVTWVLTLS